MMGLGIGLSLVNRLSCRLGLGQIVATLSNTLATSSLKGEDVAGYVAALEQIDARIAALNGLTKDVVIDMARNLDVVIPDIFAVLEELEAQEPPVDPPDPQPGAWRASSTAIKASGTNWKASGLLIDEGSGPAVTIALGQIVSVAEGSGTTGVTISLGAVANVAEGNPVAGFVIALGAVSAVAEGNPVAGYTIALGAISAVAEGSPVVGNTIELGSIAASAEGQPSGFTINLGTIANRAEG